MCTLFVMHKQEVARLGELRVGGGWGGRWGAAVGVARVYTNQHPPPLSHANEAPGISRSSASLSEWS